MNTAETYEGIVDHVNVSRGFGFIRQSNNEPDIFFHLRSLDGLFFDEQLTERRVKFTVSIDDARGPRASRVWVAN